MAMFETHPASTSRRPMGEVCLSPTPSRDDPRAHRQPTRGSLLSQLCEVTSRSSNCASPRETLLLLCVCVCRPLRISIKKKKEKKRLSLLGTFHSHRQQHADAACVPAMPQSTTDCLFQSVPPETDPIHPLGLGLVWGGKRQHRVILSACDDDPPAPSSSADLELDLELDTDLVQPNKFPVCSWRCFGWCFAFPSLQGSDHGRPVRPQMICTVCRPRAHHLFIKLHILPL